MLERKPERLLNVYANYLLPPLSPPSKLIKNLAKKNSEKSNHVIDIIHKKTRKNTIYCTTTYY